MREGHQRTNVNMVTSSSRMIAKLDTTVRASENEKETELDYEMRGAANNSSNCMDVICLFLKTFLFLVKSWTTNLKITTQKTCGFGPRSARCIQDISLLDIFKYKTSRLLIFEAFHVDRLSWWDIFLLFSSRGKGASFYFRGES